MAQGDVVSGDAAPTSGTVRYYVKSSKTGKRFDWYKWADDRSQANALREQEEAKGRLVWIGSTEPPYPQAWRPVYRTESGWIIPDPGTATVEVPIQFVRDVVSRLTVERGSFDPLLSEAEDLLTQSDRSAS